MLKHQISNEFENSNGVIVAVLCSCGHYHRKVGGIVLSNWNLDEDKANSIIRESKLTTEMASIITSD